MRTCLILLLASIATLAASAQQSVGPDVIVGSISDVGNYGTDGSGIYAYSLGTTSCNIGTVPVQWVANTNAHPVIGQHVFRLKPVAGQPYSRFEMVGMSWLKHGFTALAGSLCNSCQNPGTGSLLGVGCSDPYGASLNGSQGNGCRSDVNASTGYFPYPSTGFPAAAPTIGRRIQCQVADVNPALNAGATYWAECQYVTADDALAGNQNNNASHRLMTFGGSPSFNGALSGGTVQQQPAIMAWAAADPFVQITNVDILNDGRFIIAKRVSSLGGGNFHYEFAIHNLNSDRSGRGFTVDFPAGTVISNAGFHDINYHSSEIWSGADWTTTVTANSVNWATELFSVNQNANALRWGTTYNFWFDANAATETNKAIELFKPEPCPADPVVTAPGGYVLNTGAAFDNPTLTAPNAGPGGDDNTLNVPIGFAFNFYGTNYTACNICTNGFISFTSTSTQYQNVCMPSGSAPNAMIAAYWDDLITPPGAVMYQTIGTAPNRRFVVWWNGVGLFSNTGSIQNFKLILDETSNLITTTIISSAAGGLNATRGVENQTGSIATQASCNTAGSALANTSQTYTLNIAVVPSASLSVTGSTTPGGSLTWAVNSNALLAPVVLVASLDPGPLNLGALGTLNLGLTPGLYAVIADGAGALQPANPADVTDGYCGDYQISLSLPAGLPTGLTIYTQGVVIGTSNPPPPNGQFHITTPVTITT